MDSIAIELGSAENIRNCNSHNKDINNNHNSNSGNNNHNHNNNNNYRNDNDIFFDKSTFSTMKSSLMEKTMTQQ